MSLYLLFLKLQKVHFLLLYKRFVTGVDIDWKYVICSIIDNDTIFDLKPSTKIPVGKIIICGNHKESEENLLPEPDAPKLKFVMCHKLISQINSFHPFFAFVYYLRCLDNLFLGICFTYVSF